MARFWLAFAEKRFSRIVSGGIDETSISPLTMPEVLLDTKFLSVVPDFKKLARAGAASVGCVSRARWVDHAAERIYPRHCQDFIRALRKAGDHVTYLFFQKLTL